MPDPTWQPLLPTPNHPEYPSAHACHTTAIAEALESFFGPGRTSFSLDSLVTGETRYYDRFKDVVAEVNDARVWAGFHFRYADEDGSKLGRKVARFVVTKLLQTARLSVKRGIAVAATRCEELRPAVGYTKEKSMFPRASTVLLLCGLLCATGGGFHGQGIHAESSSAAKTAWEHVGPGLAGVMAPVAADPIAGGTIYIATMAGGVRRSLDNGETWATVNNGIASLATSALAVDAAGPQTVYVGTVGGGAYKSDDGGESWHALAGGIQGLIVHPLVADPVHPGAVYAGTLGGSMRKTVDGGNTWPVVFTGTRGIFGIAIDPNHSDVVYFGTVGAGAFKSSDAGSSWTAMSTLTPRVIWTVAVDPADSQIVYAGSNEDGVWKSSNAGVSWSPVSGAYQLPAIYALTVIPVAGSPSIVFAGTAGAGIWKSLDGGATWKRLASRRGRVCRFRQTRPPSSTPGPTKRRTFRATSARPGATSIIASAAPTPSVTQSSSTPQDTARGTHHFIRVLPPASC